jgi:hypothetical protein
MAVMSIELPSCPRAFTGGRYVEMSDAELCVRTESTEQAFTELARRFAATVRGWWSARRC